PGVAPGPRVLARGADGTGLGRRPRGRRSLDRLPGEPRAPQARDRPRAPAVGADRVGRGLSLHRVRRVKLGFRRSLFWPIAGLALLHLVLGTVTELWIVDRAIVPLETREAKARAEVVAATLAGQLAQHPAPSGAALDTLLAHHRANMGQRPAWLAVRGPNG